MRRRLIPIALMLLGSATVSAQEPSVKEVALHPAAEPDPALRYAFWPAPETRIEANAAPFASRSIILLMENAPSAEERQTYADKYNQWREMPIDELPVAEVKQYLDRHARAALAELERAEPLMRIDYDLRLTELSVAEMVGTLLPEIQSMREVARMIELRARVAVAEKRWDDFAHDMRIGFRLSDMAGSSNDLLISRLVGFAISSLMMSVVQDAIQQPDCPNFYWALAAIPDGLFEIRDAIEFESILLTKLTSGFPELPSTAIGAVRARELIRRLADEALSLGFAPADAAARDLVIGMAVVSLAEPSRELLDDTSVWSGRAHELSAPEAVLRATVLKLQRSRHQWLKWTLMPDDRWEQYAQRAEADLLATPKAADDLFVILANQLVPAVTAAKRAAQRTQQQRNLLITMESLRMHASQADELPASLKDVEPVPAWSDPLAGAAFEYQRQSPTSATIQGAPRYPGDEQSFQISLNVQSQPSNTEKSQ